MDGYEYIMSDNEKNLFTHGLSGILHHTRIERE